MLRRVKLCECLALQLIQTLLEQSRGFFYPSFY